MEPCVDFEFKDVNDFDGFNYIEENNKDVYSILNKFFIFCGVIVGGFSIGIITIGFCLIGDIEKTYKKNYRYDSDSDSDDNDDSDDEVEDTEEEYIVKYVEDYNELADRDIEKEEMDELKNKFIEDKTPRGIIVMNYDPTLCAFNYYSNSKDIPNSYLETMGRLYVVTNDCKSVFINTTLEIDKAKETKENYDQKIREQKEERERLDAEKSKDDEKKSYNVFARFKTYTPDPNNKEEQKKNIIVPEKSNRYIYKGLIEIYNEYLIKCNQKTDEFEHLDYNAYKKMRLEKERSSNEMNEAIDKAIAADDISDNISADISDDNSDPDKLAADYNY
jgi:hypothetical protein